MQYMLDTDSASYVIRRFPQSVLDTMEVKAAEKAALAYPALPIRNYAWERSGRPLQRSIIS